MRPLLEVKNLEIFYKNKQILKHLVKNLNFSILPNQTFALLGETGSGKSLAALSILRLLPAHLFFSKQSEILLHDKNLLKFSESKMRVVRRNEVAMVFQEPADKLNPVLSIGEQIAEVLSLSQKLSKTQINLEIIRLLEVVEIKDSKRVSLAYPHQLSGGMKQRVLIAMALAAKPKLLIVDEPTTALDILTEIQILELLKKLQIEYGMSILLITHDLGVAKKMADKVAIMRNGEIVEIGTADNILNTPSHPYTRKLLSISPTISPATIVENGETVLAVRGLAVQFPVRSGIFNRTKSHIDAVQNIELAIQEGETLAILGESGSGKTTLAKAILSLIPSTKGKVVLLGEDLLKLTSRQLRQKRSDFQIIFQDPLSAMDPRFMVKDILLEGMRALDIGSNEKEREERIDILLEWVGLLKEHKYRYPHQLSGGQRQRICIARALTVGPRLLVCDEPTSSLDRFVQAQIIDLLLRLQRELEIAYLFITHNIAIARAMAHRVAVMKAGKIVEYGLAEQVLERPSHPYTQALLNAEHYYQP